MAKKMGLYGKFIIKVLVLLLIVMAVFYIFKHLDLKKVSDTTGLHSFIDISGSHVKEAGTSDDPVSAPISPEEVIKQANIGDNFQAYNKPFNVEKGFADLAEYATPSVVNISAVKIVKTTTSDAALEHIDPSLRELFRQLLPNGVPNQNQSFVSLGSGFVIRSDGFIITNYHVIKDSENIQVTFTDGVKYDAVVHSTDEVTDIALLKIEASNLKTLKFGNSDLARVGEWVIAIGNPFGLGGTVSSGIVSAVGRDINVLTLSDFIQTDAAINRGNSGGPLINTKGEVVGINTAIFSTSGGSIGIGFAVPSKTIESVVSQLITQGKVVRGWLGVQIQDIDNNIAKSLNLSNTEGALVSLVVPDSPAEKAGLKAGDVILGVNGTAIKNSRILPRTVSAFAPDSVISLDVISNNSKKVLKVTIGNIPQQQESTQGTDNTGQQQSNDPVKEKTYDKLGLKVAEINPALRKYFSLQDDAEGVIIAGIAINSPLQYKGLRPGFIIVAINQQSIKTLDDLDNVLSKSSDPLLILAEDSNKGRYFLSITKKELEQGYLDQQ